MHINFKYFIVSIGSIFLALGVGILIGSNIGTNETIQKQNAAIVKDIDNRFNELKEKDDKLTSENEKLNINIEDLKKYIGKNEDVLVSGKLIGKKIAIISFNEDGANEETEKTIVKFGGEVGFNININGSSVNDDNLKKINEKLQLNLSKKEEIVKLIEESIVSSNNDGRLTALQELGIIKINSMASQFENIDSIIVNNSANMKKKGEVDMEYLISDFMKSKKQTVIVQSSGSTIDVANKFGKLKLATISNINEEIGHISFALILNDSNITGNFGKIQEGYSLIPSVK
ncbi:copper transporter [Peptostreptococcus canis]|uniref:Copper transporter n=1 Tax=Peptostreptococcus canis TaxID=1159213 RepID=A0ABR6TM37_9FIRM|nr:copper transporter [Peptostreptococcus canis]MBC2576487.1 copper transporter [Peptostreptococcus canis]MBP1998677.1 hypothetical protein [Peptostreptococcus canis]